MGNLLAQIISSKAKTSLSITSNKLLVYAHKDPEKRREFARRYYKAYREKYGDKVRAYPREHRKKNIEKARAYEREWRGRNVERERAKDREYYQKHKEDISIVKGEEVSR
ncbi:MAG: hypothetical protein Sv326_0491 [Candidatus Fermentimicrarchaeum limneticum]|uniref:Uncharacterized protein n=1 Tax=Fermentimicrarchaeum limneticum TaxID=2795018 RepID=A0A7D5XLB2_FERL1|nr:MAG: hypothetical protein Sv326_0491 [Candidatus Fermentimicrarchaeum limneticum]